MTVNVQQVLVLAAIHYHTRFYELVHVGFLNVDVFDFAFVSLVVLTTGKLGA